LNNQTTNRFPKWKTPPYSLVASLALVTLGVLFTWWTVTQKEREMRSDLLQHTQLAVQAFDIGRIKKLTGTEADLENPIYLRLKEQFAVLRSANPQCRFFYLVGRNTDGKIFFFLESEPVDSKDYSPPGQVYVEVPEGFRSVSSIPPLPKGLTPTAGAPGSQD
jgi:hypothetical protein